MFKKSFLLTLIVVGLLLAVSTAVGARSEPAIARESGGYAQKDLSNKSAYLETTPFNEASLSIHTSGQELNITAPTFGGEIQRNRYIYLCMKPCPLRDQAQ